MMIVSAHAFLASLKLRLDLANNIIYIYIYIYIVYHLLVCIYIYIYSIYIYIYMLEYDTRSQSPFGLQVPGSWVPHPAATTRKCACMTRAQGRTLGLGFRVWGLGFRV